MAFKGPLRGVYLVYYNICH